MTDSNELIINKTLNWVRSFIIKLSICPFAKKAVDDDSLRLAVSASSKVAEALEELMLECERLEANPQIETTLLIYPDLFKDFFDYLDFVDLAEKLMTELEYESIFQLATFHPDYCFADVDFDEVSNYTNRSPYPMLHLLREESIEKAIAYYGNTEEIPEKNIATMNKLGLEAILKIIQQ